MAKAPAKTKEKTAELPEEATTHEVAVKAATNIAISEIPDFGDDAGAGLSEVDKDSLAIPFLVVLQSNSPQCNEADGKYIEGARAGMLWNSVSNALYPGKVGVYFMLSEYQRRFIHWGARGTPSAGFKGEHFPEDAERWKAEGVVIEQDGKLLYPFPNTGELNKDICDRLTDTRNHFGVIYDAETGNASRVLLSLSSTQIKKSKTLLSILSELKIPNKSGQKVTPPTWYSLMHLTTVPESNEKGSWFGLKVEHARVLDLTNADEIEAYNIAKKFHQDVHAGTAGPVNYDQAGDTGDDAPINSF